MDESYPGERYAGSAPYWEDMAFHDWLDGLTTEEVTIWLMVFCDVEVISRDGETVLFRSQHPLPSSVSLAIQDRAEDIFSFLRYDMPEDLQHEFSD